MLAHNAFGDGGVTSTQGAVGDYAGNAGNNEQGGNKYWRPSANGTIITAEMFDHNPAGRKTWESNMSFQMITDGLSNTFLVGEKHIPIVANEQQGSLYNGDNQNNCARVAGRRAPIASGDGDLTLCRKISSCQSHHSGPCICDTFGSWHPEVCQFLFADGHVDALSSNADLIIFDRMAARNDGQTIGIEY